MSVPDADTLIRLAEILEVYVSELLGTKIENIQLALKRLKEEMEVLSHE